MYHRHKLSDLMYPFRFSAGVVFHTSDDLGVRHFPMYPLQKEGQANHVNACRPSGHDTAELGELVDGISQLSLGSWGMLSVICETGFSTSGRFHLLSNNLFSVLPFSLFDLHFYVWI
jgi:hypothetical protein